MAGLIYQMLWIKLLTLTFGVTTMAVSTVLTSFFGGLALGGYLGGRWIDNHEDGLKWYGLAEILIGLYALLFSLLLNFNNSIYVLIAQRLMMDFYALSILKFILSTMLLAIPTTLMGATLPILSKILANSQTRFAKNIGGLYAINTMGAVVGALATAFFLIPNMGMKTILYSTGVLNIVIGGIAISVSKVYSKNYKTQTDSMPKGQPSSIDSERMPSYFFTLLILGFALSGFTGLAYEVIWTRVLGFILTGTIYAFAIVLATFLTGIAVGSFVFSQFLDRFRGLGWVISMLAVVEALIGLSSIGLIILYDKMPAFEFYNKIDATPIWGEFVYLNFFTSFISLFLPTFLFGATFPLVCKIYGWRIEKIGSKIGNIYSVNTIGGIFGSFASGFVLIPFFGMQNSIVLMGYVNLGLGILFMFFNPFITNKFKYMFLSVSFAVTVALILLLPQNMPKSLHKSFLKSNESMLFYEEGAAATVMIAEREGIDITASNKRLWVNGNMATAAFYEGLQINRFQGVLPMIIHPNPKEVLVICFGSGTTFGTLSQFDVNQVDNVEIASTVIKGAPYFAKENMDVLHNLKSRIIIDDGRSYLEVTSKKYDVITEEPMHPSLAGVVNLYTKEYYELTKAHLKDGGIMSQWIPLYNLSIEDVRMLVKTFNSVFPHTTIWVANTDIFMIGSSTRTNISYALIEERLALPNVRALLKEIDMEDPLEILNTFLMNEDMVRAYSKNASIVTDDMPLIEFTGPKSLNVNTISPNIAELLKYKETILPYLVISQQYSSKEMISRKMERKFLASRYNLIGRAYYAAGNFNKAVDYFDAALRFDSEDRNSLHYKRKLRFYSIKF
ncbi:MAG: fused MFS/spermidine synthase [Deltaproteobacteria bacterium]|nr:fused MFS/spermidine synthase [Deltaproteobacteria bacterium]